MSAKIVRVICKGEDCNFSKKYLIYNDFTLEHSDPVIKECIDDSRKCLNFIPEDVEVKCSMVTK